MPPGIAGVEPKLAFSYTAGSVDGPLGLGWSLQGLSVITRCPATPATDGQRAGVLFRPTDKLCLDGQRLIHTDEAGGPLSGADHARGVAAAYREYRTERDSFARIRAYGSANGSDIHGPAYFKVWTKAGLIYEYGNTTDARIEAQGSNVVMAWAVNRISDTLANHIDFTYEERDVAWGSGPGGAPRVGKEWNLSRIFYTGRASQAASNRVDFVYDDRFFGRSEAYHAGSKNLSIRRLIEVRTFTNQQASDPLPAPGALPASNSIPVKVYKLEYEPTASAATGRNRLAKIRECSGRTTTRCLPPHEFIYSDNPSGQVYGHAPGFNLGSTPLHSSTGLYGTIVGDFDGDGRTDILRWANNYAENAMFLSRPQGTAAAPTWSFQSVPTITDTYLFSSNGCFYTIAADFNADGKTDLLRVFSNTSGDGVVISCPITGVSQLYLATTGGQFGAPMPVPMHLLRHRQQPRFCPPGDKLCPDQLECQPTGPGSNFHIADFNGDGFLDVLKTFKAAMTLTMAKDPNCKSFLLQCSGPEGCNELWAGNGSGGFSKIPLAQSGLPATSIWAAPNLPSGTPIGDLDNLFVDLNDDGRADILTQSSTTYYSTPTGYVSASMPFCSAPIPVDGNGDRRVDLLCSESTGLHGRTGLGGQSGFVTTLSGLEALGTLNALDAGVEATDFNGDGRVDILLWRSDTNNTLYLANADGTYTADNSFTFRMGQLRDRRNRMFDFRLGDFTGQGHLEILRIDNDPNAGRLFVKNNPAVPDELVQVKSPSGLVTDLSYRALTDPFAPLIYQSDRGTAQASSYPNLDLSAPIRVVDTVTRQSGVGATPLTTAQKFSYRGLKVDFNGRGSLGFREVEREHQGPNGGWLTSVTNYRQDWPFVGLTNSTALRLNRIGQSGQQLSGSSYVYCDKAAGVSGCPEAGVPASAVRKPYLRRVVETANDLATGYALPTVTTDNTFNSFGDPDAIGVTTTMAGFGPFSKTTTNTYTSNTSGDNWILGRLTRSQVQSTAPSPLLTASAGSAPNATANQGSVLAVSVSPTVIDVVGTAPGPLSAQATASATGGVGPYTYSWARTGGTTTRIQVTGTATATFRPTPDLTWQQSFTEQFTVTASDKTGAQITRTLSVTFRLGVQPPAPTVTVAPATLTASRPNPGIVSGGATATVAGGVPPLTVAWARVAGTTSLVTVTNPQSLTPTFNANLGWGQATNETFRVTITDSIARQATGTRDVVVRFSVPTAPPAVSVTPSAVTASRPNPGTLTANATVNVSNGLAPFTYSWTRLMGSRITVTGGQSASFSASVGWAENFTETFRATVTDALSRTTTADVNVTFTTPSALSATVPGSATGERVGSGVVTSNTISVSPSGGTGGYTYQWSPATVNGINVSSTTAQSVNFSANLASGTAASGTFTVLVSDSAGNTVSPANGVVATLSVISAPAVAISPTSISVSRGVPNGSTPTFTYPINASVSGGVAPYTMTWVFISGSTKITVSPNPVVATAQAFYFTATLRSDDIQDATYQLFVTDSAGQQTATPYVSIRYVSTCTGFCP